MSALRATLLVGEGNFSFSASLALNLLEHNCYITATCLQSQEEALRHKGTATNIQTIRDSGGEVLFEVDSTRLEKCASLHGCVFDCVVFNFPHCGRKSGVKKNRELLKNFFLSCVLVLRKEGEVHVALCNGQGGTPADQPTREWHNSWQVVAMAAEAGLILSDVRPFDSDKHDSYKCTGYRSQDKGFHVEKGLTHVFTRGLPHSAPQRLSVEETVGGQRIKYHIPAELSDYIHRGFLSPGSVHPVKLVQDFLLEGLAKEWSISMVTEPLPILLHLSPKQLQTCCPEIDPTHCYRIPPSYTHTPHIHNPIDTHTVTDTHTSTDKHAPCSDDDKHADTLSDTLADTHITSDRRGEEEEEPWDEDGGSKAERDINGVCEGESGVGFVLRPSLLPQMEELVTLREERDQKEGTSGGREGDREVEGKGVSGGRVEEGQTEGSSRVIGGFIGVLSSISGLVLKRFPISPWGPPAFHQLLLCGVCTAASKPIEALGRSLEVLLAPHRVSLASEEGVLGLMAEPMGRIGRVWVSDVADDVTKVCVRVSLSLDLLATLVFSLPDWRLLWSKDPRFLKEFLLKPSPGKPFRPFSLFPQRFSYDISFWAGPSWEEGEFHAVVREASRGAVEQVELLDTFFHPDHTHTSYCYRLTYQSHTSALSHTHAMKLHTHLQTLLSTRMLGTVR